MYTYTILYTYVLFAYTCILHYTILYTCVILYTILLHIFTPILYIHICIGIVYAVKRIKSIISTEGENRVITKEVCAHAALQGCSYIVQYYNSWIDEGQLYIQTELCALGTLDSLIEQKIDRLHPNNSVIGIHGGGGGGNIHNHMTSRADSFDLSYMTQPAPPSSTSHLIHTPHPTLFNNTPTPTIPTYNNNHSNSSNNSISMNISQDIPIQSEGGHSSDPLPTSSTITSDYTIGSMKGDNTNNNTTATANNNGNNNNSNSNGNNTIHIEGAIDIVEEGESPHTLPSPVAGMYILYLYYILTVFTSTTICYIYAVKNIFYNNSAHIHFIYYTCILRYTCPGHQPSSPSSVDTVERALWTILYQIATAVHFMHNKGKDQLVYIVLYYEVEYSDVYFCTKIRFMD